MTSSTSNQGEQKNALDAPKTPATNKTPTRVANHNYDNLHTPIASTKRPRSSLKGAATPTATPGRRSNPEVPLSPMHPIKPVHRESAEKAPDESSSSWVSRKVDQFFSPVLSLIHNSEEEEQSPGAHPSTSSSSSDSPGEGLARNENVDESEEDVQSDDGSLSIQGQEMPENEDFNPWQFIQSLPPYPDVCHHRPPISLPPKDSQDPPITLVLDLDETLVHCSVESVPDADLVFPVDFHGTTYQVHVKLRPYLFQFLERCQKHFEVVLFTASQKIYANELLNRIDPEGKYIQHRLYRESCLHVEGNFLKDLSVLGRDLSKTILVDNSPHAFGYQVENGIPIESWFDDPNDRELLKLDRFLQRHILGVHDVRPVLDNKFQCRRLVREAPALFFGEE